MSCVIYFNKKGPTNTLNFFSRTLDREFDREFEIPGFDRDFWFGEPLLRYLERNSELKKLAPLSDTKSFAGILNVSYLRMLL